MLKLLRTLQQQKIISLADYYFAKLIDDKQQGFSYSDLQKNLAVLLAALASYGQGQGHSCLLLNNNLYYNLFNLRIQGTYRQYLAQIYQLIDNLPIQQWQHHLNEHIAFTQVPNQISAPLLFQHNSLYLYRMWQDELHIAQYFKNAASQTKNFSEPELQAIHQILAKYFPEQTSPNWQKIATAIALRQGFCLISGGPGTGKTYTVARLLLVLQELQLAKQAMPWRIKLAAPTGKAAARLTESINKALDQLAPQSELRQLISSDACTIHSLLGIRMYEDRARFNDEQPLDIDLLVVDEASMIDQSLMAKLFNALPAATKLILLGDKDQLASVEAGAILGELAHFLAQDYSPNMLDYLQKTTEESLSISKANSAIRDCLCHLQKSNRFSSDSGIGQLAMTINQADSQKSWELLQQHTQLELIEYAPLSTTTEQISHILNTASQAYRLYLQAIQQPISEFNQKNLQLIFHAFNHFRLLSALRIGEFGVENLNQLIAEKLRQQGLLTFKHSRDWFHGKPIMVVQNDTNVNLFNGDIGLFLVDTKGNGRVWFEQSIGLYRPVSASRIPKHEMAFLMTVHKSQGSEFEHCCLVLPNEPNPVICKELIYTAVTRAKQKLTLFSSYDVWRYAVENPIQRQSGLAKQLIS